MIFCVEDDSSIRELIVYTLKNTGFQAEGFVDSAEFFPALSQQTPELILLDIMLPGMDGIEILKRIKGSKATKDIPVILLTAKGTEYDKVIGLDSGADDYVTKPFGMMELISRIKAVLRRAQPREQSNQLSCGDIQLQADKHLVTAGGQEVQLTLKEFEMLRYLMENRSLVLSRDVLLERIWGYDFDGETRTVDVHVRTLRQKLGKSGQLIETVRGVGYLIKEQ
ncbi:response regulator transcription factor [Aminipila butyrica]|uniref:Stage 0 sporulation protein A homolog n=1 Tax=Aminipila butyrica TaxID=433296 RepID=A0A858BYF9_9FIRM|nr:response regulator transcription factor [Aminipila butyrica]QIB70617.1 response regulator transcription factor [Aminipila butyrica]